MHESVLFKRNSCSCCLGGAIAAAGTSEVSMFDRVTFSSNSAEMGGAVYLRYATLILNQGATINLPIIMLKNLVEAFLMKTIVITTMI